MNEKYPSSISWYYDPIIEMTDDEISELQSMDYFKKYLSTDYWKKVREKFFEKFDKICHECPSGTENSVIQLHHKGYDIENYNTDSHKTIFGRERYCDLMPLCKKHHDARHLRTDKGDRATSSTMDNAKVRYIGFYIGKYKDENQVQIHLSCTTEKGIKKDRSSWKDATVKVNVGNWYSIYDWKEIYLSKEDAHEYTNSYDSLSQEDKKSFLLKKGIDEEFLNRCLREGYVPRDRVFKDKENDYMAETN